MLAVRFLFITKCLSPFFPTLSTESLFPWPAMTVHTSPPTIFQELIDLVIDHLHDDKSSLASCSLVAKSWLPCSHFHLFSSLRVAEGGKQASHDRLVDDFSAFIRFLQYDASPRVRSTIRHLILMNDIQPKSSWRYPLLTAERMNYIVSQLPFLYSLELHQLIFVGSEGTLLPSGLATHVKRLSVKYIGLSVRVESTLWDLLKSFPGLTHVEISSIDGLKKRPQQELDVPILRPVHLVLGPGSGMQGSLMSSIHPFIDASRLESLNLVGGVLGELEIALRSAISQARCTLLHFALDVSKCKHVAFFIVSIELTSPSGWYPSYVRPSWCEIGLSSCLRLQAFCITLLLAETPTFVTHSWNFGIEMVASLPSSIRSITFIVSQSGRSEVLVSRLSDSIDWVQMDHVLATFPQLERVRIRYQDSGRGSLALTALECTQESEVIQRELHYANSRGILSFDLGALT